MTTQELIKKILNRLGKMKIIILLCGIAVAVCMYLYAKSVPAVYSVKTTVFPLNTSQDKGQSSRISELIGGGGGGGSKSVSDDANVSIEEVGRSRKVREAVAGASVPSLDNKKVATLLIEEYNKRRTFREPKMEMPRSDSGLINVGSMLLDRNYVIKFNKNDLLEITFSSTDNRLLQPVSYILIDKISQFYKELKIEKAKEDFEFISAKVDSFDRVLAQFDRRRIYMDNHTLFVPEDKLQYSIPEHNLESEKALVKSQRNAAVSNREDALWKLQKITPIIQILDRPEPPFFPQQPSASVYAVIGFFIGCFVFALLFISGILYKYANQEINKALSKPAAALNTTTTA